MGWSLTAPHMNPERVDAFFGDKHRFSRIDQLKHIARIGVSVDVLPGGDLTKELEHENHPSAEIFHEEVWEKAAAGVACGRAIVFPRNTRGRYRVCGCHQQGSLKSAKIL